MRLIARFALALPASVAALAAAPVAGAGPIRDRIFQPPATPLLQQARPAGFESVRVTTADRLALTGLLHPGRPDRPLLLVFHGNASSAAGAAQWLEPLARRGYTLVMAEQRGYSGNPGSPGEQGFDADAEAFFALARSRAAGRKVIVLGHSMGGGVGFGLAARHRLDALVTIGTFTSVTAMAPKIARAFITDRFDNLSRVPSLDEPFYLIHAEDDPVIPVAHGQSLYREAVRSGRSGAALALATGGHQPGGEAIATLIDAIAAAGPDHRPKVDLPGVTVRSFSVVRATAKPASTPR